MLNRRNINGFTLIEILISMLLSMFLISALLYLFHNVLQHNKQEKILIELQENARFFLQQWLLDARQAGYFGCKSIRWLHLAAPAVNTLAISEANAFKIYSFKDKPEDFDFLPKSSHVISLFEYADQFENIKCDLEYPNEASYTKYKKTKLTFKKGEWVILENCENASINRIKNIQVKNNKVTIKFEKDFENFSGNKFFLEMGLLHEYIYYLKNFNSNPNNLKVNSYESNMLHRRDLLESSSKPDGLSSALIDFKFSKESKKNNNLIHAYFFIKSKNIWNGKMIHFKFLINKEYISYNSFNYIALLSLHFYNENLGNYGKKLGIEKFK